MKTTEIHDLWAYARDLRITFPRSPRETLGGYVIAARTLDKCRAALLGVQGEYLFNCPLDRRFFDFAAIDADEFKNFVAGGADDAEVAEFINRHSRQRTREEIVRWNNEMRYKRISELDEESQVFLEDYIRENIPEYRTIHHWFDVYDIEEGRM